MSVSRPKPVSVVALWLLFLVTMIAACDSAEATPDRDREAAEALGVEGPDMTEGVEVVETLGQVPLGINVSELDRYVLRARLLAIAPGGQVAVHRHEGRPGVAYILEGEMVEYRDGGERGLTRRAGEASFESSGVVHWWRNETDDPASVLVVDALPVED